MKKNSKEIYMAPQTSVDGYFYADVLCDSADATNESFTEEVEIEW